MANRPQIIVLGRQGAGKGTQCGRLAAHLSVPHISTGDLFRAAVLSGSPIGRQVEQVLESGQLVSDEIVVDVVRDRVSTEGLEDSGYLFDGFPRTVPQAEAYFATPSAPDTSAASGLDLTAEHRLAQVVALDLSVPEAVVRDRIARRRVCPVDNWTTTVSDPSVESVVCPDGHLAVQRADDQPDAVERRLSLFAAETAPVAAWFGSRGRLVSVDGTGDPDDVFARVLVALDPFLDVARPQG